MIKLRNYPYPYRALLSICSDLDETPNEEIYFETSRYLNTTMDTLLGKGVGLEVGNTIYFEMPAGQFSFNSASNEGKTRILELIRSGHIDCLHSFGDLVESREDALKYWSFLKNQGCDLKIWIDHAQAPTNLDTDIMCGKGAIAGSPAYHADVLFGEGGIEYVWIGRVTSVIAQGVKRTLRGIFCIQHPISSMRTIIKELAKGYLGKKYRKKYLMHTLNKTMHRTHLNDGAAVIEFIRSNPSWAGVSQFEKGRDLDKVLTDKMINQLISAEGSCILYTHLGKIHTIDSPFTEKTKKALEMLSQKSHSGAVLVLTTKRQLDYIKARDSIRYRVESQGEKTKIIIENEGCTSDRLQGLTWYVDNPDNVDIYVNNELVDGVIRTSQDFKGMQCVMIPLEPLEYPEV